MKGGTVDSEEIEETKKTLKKEILQRRVDFRGKSKKENTIEVTKKLLEEKKSLKEIMKERVLVENTVIGHLEKIQKKYPDLDFSYLKPKSKLIDSVKKAVQEIKKKKKEDDFMINGKIKLKSIFLELKEKISYQDIKLALILGKISF
jgi:Skp family chaperone for outer membrane proteins